VRDKVNAKPQSRQEKSNTKERERTDVIFLFLALLPLAIWRLGVHLN
jgi:hypothetical protein